MKNIRQLVFENRSSFLEQQRMPAHEIEIQNLIGNLDEVSVCYEARWGVDRLQELVSDHMKQKWFRQFDKLCAAIECNDLSALRELVPGTIRAYAALEKEAEERGHIKYDPACWEIYLPESQRTILMVKNNADAKIMSKSGLEVWTLQEVARFLDAQSKNISEVKKIFPGAVVEKVDFDFSVGDEINF